MSAPRVFSALSSWWTTAVLLLLACGAYMYFSFGEAAFAHWGDFLLRRPAGIVLYLGLVLNLAAATARTVRGGLSAPAPDPAAIREMKASAAVPSGVLSLEEAADFMRSWGFAPRTAGSGLAAVRNRYAFLPGTVFRIGTVVLLVSLLVSAHLRQRGEGVFREGGKKQLLGTAVAVERISANLPPDYFRVGEEGGFRLYGVSAMLSCADGSHRVGSAFPSRAAGSYFRITHVGLILPVSLRSGDTDAAADAYPDVLPPGRTDKVSLGGRTLQVSLLPERTITKGVLKGEQFNLERPLYLVAVQKGTAGTETEFRLRPGGSAVSGGMRVGLGGSAPYVKLQAVRDPALPWIYIGLAVMLGGLASMLSRFFWYRREFLAVEQDGVVYLGYEEEFFRKWGVLRFHDAMKRLGAADQP